MTRNNVTNAIALIESLNGIGDEFVIIEQSDRKDKELMLNYSRKNKKVRVCSSVALGYQEPLRMYGLGRCSNEWVLHIDVDERLSEGLASGIKRLISTTIYDAFAIRRYEEVREGKRTGFFTWQIKLYKRHRVLYLGILHESPIVRGRLGRLEEGRYYTEQMGEIKGKAGAEYTKIYKFTDRLSYSAYNDRLLDYLAKLTLSKDREIRRTAAGRLVGGWLSIYELVSRRRPEQEISDLDYFVFYSIINIGYSVRMRDPWLLLCTVPNAMKNLERMRRWKSEPDSAATFEASRIINRIGIIRFLHLERDTEIARLYRKYRGKRQGIDLLIQLLKERYSKMSHQSNP